MQQSPAKSYETVLSKPYENEAIAIQVPAFSNPTVQQPKGRRTRARNVILLYSKATLTETHTVGQGRGDKSVGIVYAVGCIPGQLIKLALCWINTRDKRRVSMHNFH